MRIRPCLAWSQRTCAATGCKRPDDTVCPLRACLGVLFQGLTQTPQYRPSASSRLWPARPAALCLPDPCGLGSDSHAGKVFSGKLLKFLTQTGSESSSFLGLSRFEEPQSLRN